jgi:hypothetical protein
MPTGRVLFTHVKHNPSETMPTLAYRIQTLTIGQELSTRASIVGPHVVWEPGTVAVTADQAVAAAAQGGRPGRSDEAKAFLRRVLAQGPVPVKAIYEEAQAHGLSRDQLHRAKAKLPITVRRVGAGREGGWVWELGEEPL